MRAFCPLRSSWPAVGDEDTRGSMLHDYSHRLCTPGAIFYMSVMLASLFFSKKPYTCTQTHTHSDTQTHRLSLSLSLYLYLSTGCITCSLLPRVETLIPTWTACRRFLSSRSERGSSQSHPPCVVTVTALRLLLQQPQAGSLHLPVTAALCGERGRAVACTSGCWSASKHRTPEPAPSPAGLCGKQGGRQGGERAACRSLSSPVLIGRKDLPLDSCLHWPCPQGCTRSTPSLGQPKAGPGTQSSWPAGKGGRDSRQWRQLFWVLF